MSTTNEIPTLAPGHTFCEQLKGCVIDGFTIQYATDIESARSAVLTARVTGSIGATYSTQKAFQAPYKLAKVVRNA